MVVGKNGWGAPQLIRVFCGRRGESMMGALTASILAVSALRAGTTPPPVTVDLRKIGHVQPKGRVQDYRLPVVEALIAAGPAAIPFLVSKLEDTTKVEGHVFDYWTDVRVGDIALVILCDLFSRPTGVHPTVPGLQWDAILERRDADSPGNELLYAFIAKHGRRGIRLRIEELLQPFGASLVWDKEERCFKPAK